MIKDKDEWIKDFLASDRVDQIWKNLPPQRQQKNVLFSDKIVQGEDIPWTPRESELALGNLDIQPFYILDYISSQTDGVIYDVGCGMNIFKQFYNVIGIDWDHPNADLHIAFDRGLAARNWQKIDAAVSICAIHFYHIDKLMDTVLDFFNMIKPGGLGYLAINVRKIMDNTPELHPREVVERVRSCFKEITSRQRDLGEVIYFEDLIDLFPSDGMNGNVRILIRRNT